MSSKTEMVAVRDGETSVVVDSRAWPIVFATWFGAATEKLAEHYFEQQTRLFDRARREGQPFILISDTFAATRPSATARKRIAELTTAQPADVPGLSLSSYIVIENALIRGAVTALRWVTTSMDASETVESIDVAIERALAALDEAGVARPAGFRASDYRRPTPPG